MKKAAIIDLGSNSIRMSIFEVLDENKFRPLKQFRKMIRLSEGMGEKRELQPEARLRAVQALLEYKSISQKEGTDHLLAMATAAVRRASNQKDFIREVEETTGIKLNVLSGEEEATLDCLAITKTLGIEKGIVCDIGGGSTEFIAILDGEMQIPPISIPIGSRTLTEMFFSGGETPDAISEANAYIEKKISELPWLDKMQNAHIVGIGGTLRALAKLHSADTTNEPISEHHISAEETDRLFREISESSFDQRKTMIGIGEERADIILAGLLILMKLKNQIASPEIAVADVGIREGAMHTLLEQSPESE